MIKKHFNIELRIYYDGEMIYKGDGVICITDDEFEGYVALDYIYGCFENKNLQVEIFKFDPELGIEHNIFKSNVDMLELPNDFYLHNDSKIFKHTAKLQMRKSTFKDVQDYDEHLEEVKEIHGF